MIAGLAYSGSACRDHSRAAPPSSNYDPHTGRLLTVTYDADRDGRNDATAYFEGATLQRIELDIDGNHKVERWDFYRPDRTLLKVGLASRNDGVMDSQAFYGPSGALERIEISTNRNGVFNRTETYASGLLLSSAEDTNGDGKPDKWETYRLQPLLTPGEPAYAITSSAFDYVGRGTPQRRFNYGSDGAVVSVEVDPDGKGRFVAATAAAPSGAVGPARHPEPAPRAAQRRE